MTLSIGIVIMTVYLLAFSFYKYKNYLNNKLFKNKIIESENFMKMYDDYTAFVKKYPDFQKHQQAINNFMKGNKK